jgi:hypothetical protein
MVIAMKQKSSTVIQNMKFGSIKRIITPLQKRRQERIEDLMRRPLYQEATRSVFFIIILFIDAFLPLELYNDLSLPYNTACALVILGIFLCSEIYIYNLIWGKKGRWSIDKYKNKSNEINGKKE